MWNYFEINLKFAFKLYLCKIPNESPTAFFRPSFPGFKIFSLKVANALKGIVKRGTSKPSTVSLRNSHPSFPAWGPLCFPRWTPGSQFSGRWLFKIKKAMKPSPDLSRWDTTPTLQNRRGQMIWGCEFSPSQLPAQQQPVVLSQAATQTERSLTPSLGCSWRS